MRIKKWTVIFIIVILAMLIPVAGAFSADKTDLDTQETTPSKIEKTIPLKGSWLPVPVILTEPAFGYGIALGLGYIHPQNDTGGSGLGKSIETGSSVISGRSGHKPPPSVTGIAAGYTENETKFGAVGHSASWRQDTIRYLGALAYADVYSTYYILDLPLNFNIEGAALYQDLKFRLGNSHFFVGDYRYWNSKLKLLSFHQPHPKFVLGLRLEISTVSGDAPFYG